MPLGYERLNAKQQSPNEKIVFIKPLEGPDKATSQDFLERIAAICAPIMKANYLSVVSLEEYEPNREFWGRNFNAGESIQLVLKSPSSGRWLPFRFVQMVMMHELAHCKQMNHSKAFWKVRNEYTAELKALWDKGYTGNGFWGKGQTLYDGQYTQDNMPSTEQMPQHLCGGVYQSRRGKRKRKNGADKEILSYAERKQRRIEKKFGVNGMALGQDEEVRVGLEKGKRVPAKPRVAGSVRGRELRAAAALARLEQAREVTVKGEPDSADSDDEYEYDERLIKEEALDWNGNKILDSKGHGMVKVCEEEDAADDHDARRELEEFEIFGFKGGNTSSASTKSVMGRNPISIKEEDISTASESENEEPCSAKCVVASATNTDSSKTSPPLLHVQPQTTNVDHNNVGLPIPRSMTNPSYMSQSKGVSVLPEPTPHTQKGIPCTSNIMKSPRHDEHSNGIECIVCSLTNALDALTCVACAHVLYPDKLPGHWRCQSATCRRSQYINASDSGRCGICGVLDSNQ